MRQKNILILTGSGISASSGIPTFRTDNGLWENENVNDVCTVQALKEHPQRLFEFYKKLKNKYRTALPNEAHKALVKLNDKFNTTIWTQNVDTLHEDAGSSNVIHMHGTMDVVDTITKRLWNYDDITEYQSWMRPNVVLFGEDIKLDNNQLITGAKGCDYFLSIGTSDNVWPANGCYKLLPRTCKKIQFNLTRTLYSQVYDEVILGDCAVTLPEYVEKLIKEETAL